MKKNIIAIALLILPFIISAQTIYYVDGTNGNNLNNGTTLASAWKTIQKAFDVAIPGSIVYIRGGTYKENVYANVSGTPGNPITFRNYQNESVILDGTGTTQNDMLYVEDQSYLIIQNFTIQNKVKNNATGLTISCTPSGKVSDIVVKNMKITGINWSSNPNAIPTSNNNSNPFVVYGQGTNQSNAIIRITIDNCEIYNNITGFSEALTMDGNVDTFAISNNLVHDNKNIGILMAGNYKVSSNSQMDHARNGRCYQNTCYNNVSNYATSGGIYVDGGWNNIIERNITYGNGYGIEIGCEENGTTSGITVRDNIFYNNKEAGLAIGGYTTSTTGQVLNTSVMNNTFLKNDYSNSGVGEMYISKMSNCIIRNNIFYTNNQNILISRDNITPFSGNTINYNCWYTPNNNSNNITVTWGTATHTTFANYKIQTGMDGNSFYIDPLIVNTNTVTPDFHLQNLSTCIDAGDPAFSTGIGETDFFGDVRVNNTKVDIGAHEFNVATDVQNKMSDNNIVSYAYPNPFTSQTSIFLNINIQNAELDLFNVIGEGVKKIKNNSGQQIKIEGGDLKPGIYFYKIIHDNAIIATGKLVLE